VTEDYQWPTSSKAAVRCFPANFVAGPWVASVIGEGRDFLVAGRFFAQAFCSDTCSRVWYP
jgi:hypothetical protein